MLNSQLFLFDFINLALCHSTYLDRGQKRRRQQFFALHLDTVFHHVWVQENHTSVFEPAGPLHTSQSRPRNLSKRPSFHQLWSRDIKLWFLNISCMFVCLIEENKVYYLGRKVVRCKGGRLCRSLCSHCHVEPQMEQGWCTSFYEALFQDCVLHKNK